MSSQNIDPQVVAVIISRSQTCFRNNFRYGLLKYGLVSPWPAHAHQAYRMPIKYESKKPAAKFCNFLNQQTAMEETICKLKGLVASVYGYVLTSVVRTKSDSPTDEWEQSGAEKSIASYFHLFNKMVKTSWILSKTNSLKLGHLFLYYVVIDHLPPWEPPSPRHGLNSTEGYLVMNHFPLLRHPAPPLPFPLPKLSLGSRLNLASRLSLKHISKEKIQKTSCPTYAKGRDIRTKNSMSLKRWES